MAKEKKVTKFANMADLKDEKKVVKKDIKKVKAKDAKKKK